MNCTYPEGSPTVVTPPVREPVTLEEVKAHLRVDGTYSDLMLTGLIRAAREHVENETGRSLITRTLQFHFEGFGECMSLPRPPLVAVSTVEYLDTEGTWQTADGATYNVDGVLEPGAVVLAGDATWPETKEVRNAVRITVTAGYGETPADVPEELRLAMKFHCQAHFDNDPNTRKSLQETTMNLMAPYVVHYV